MKHSARQAFSVAEILIALALMGIIAMMVIPKIMIANDDKTMTSAVRESYALVGEMFLNRKINPNYIPVNIGSNEAGQFALYIHDHLNAVSSAYSGSGSDYCTTAGNYFVLHNKVTIRQICDSSLTNGLTGLAEAVLLVTVQVPTTTNKAPLPTYVIVLPNEVVNNTNVDRYTTKYGFTKNRNDWNMQADP